MRVEHETCWTIHGTHLECILSQKKLTGLAGGVKMVNVTDKKRHGHMASEPSLGPWMVEEPLKSIVICPTGDHWMIWDEFETFSFGQELFLYIYAFELRDRPTCDFFHRGGPPSAETAHFRGGVFQSYKFSYHWWYTRRPVFPSLTNYFWSGPKKPAFLTIFGLWGPFGRP